MAVVSALVRAGLRRHVGGLVAIALLVAVGVGVGLASLEVAARTERAYPDYLRRADVGQLVVNPVLVTDRTEAIFRSVPGVLSVTTDSLLTASADDGHPRSQLEADSGFLQLRTSADGRYLVQDRPVVREGRMIGSGAEAFLSVEAADALGVEVGDLLPLAFWAPAYDGPGSRPDTTPIDPIGKVEVRVVGVGVFSDEVLADELFPRVKILVTPDVGEPFDCTLSHPAADDPSPIEELAAKLIPPGCALSYRYYSLRTEGGDAGAAAVADALAQRFREENEHLPAGMRENDIGFTVIPSFRADDADRVRHSLAPAVTALRAFGITAGLATIGVALLLTLRILRRDEADIAVGRSLGIGARHRALALAATPAAAALVGVGGAVLVAWLASGAGPIASARKVEPGGRLGLSSAIVLPLAATIVLLLLGLAAAAARAARRPAAAPSAPAARPRTTARLGRPLSLALGVRAALRGRSAGTLLVAAATAVAAVTATVVFSTSLLRLVDEPDQFGWPYDAAALVNAGYGEADLGAIAASLDRPEVERWGIAVVSGGLTIDGETVPFVASRAGFDDLAGDAALVSGRTPRGDGELALGSVTARTLGLGVGDEATLTTPYGEHQARVTGLVVLPTIGPLESDRASLGTGALLPQPLYETLLAGAEDQAGQTPAELADSQASFVAIDLAAGVDAAGFMASLGDEVASWDQNQAQPNTYTRPVRPATIVDAAAMRDVPLLLAGAFALTMAGSVGAGIAAGTRARARELAVLRAFGATPGQLRASVRWHALAVAAIGLAIGLPVGVALGRTAFSAFARDIGAVPTPAVPLALLGLTAAAVLAVGLLAAAVPAQRATRAGFGLGLRHGSVAQGQPEGR